MWPHDWFFSQSQKGLVPLPTPRCTRRCPLHSPAQPKRIDCRRCRKAGRRIGISTEVLISPATWLWPIKYSMKQHIPLWEPGTTTNRKKKQKWPLAMRKPVPAAGPSAYNWHVPARRCGGNRSNYTGSEPTSSRPRLIRSRPIIGKPRVSRTSSSAKGGVLPV